jgi:hypothetical protein
MEKFADILKVGGKTNSLGRAGEVLNTVLGDKSMLVELYDCLFADDAWVRMRAADCLEKVCRVHPDWIEPYIDRMLHDLVSSKQPSIQWHLAQMIVEVKLTEDQRQHAIAWLKKLLSSIEVDWIVSVNSMKTLVQFSHEGTLAKGEVMPLFEIQRQHTSNTVRKKAAQFLQDIGQ